MKNITKSKKVDHDFRNNNKLWQITLDAMSESVFLIDSDHKILQCNKATLDILGKTNYNEIIDHSCWELLHGTYEPVDWCPVVRMKLTGQRETTVRMINDRWVKISAEPVFNNEGEIIGAVHIITDITARKRAEESLKESEQQYLTILNSLSDAMHVVDKDLKITFQNPAMIQWLKKLNLKSDNIGKTIFQAFPFLNYDKVYREYAKVFKNKEFLNTAEASKLFDRNYYTETLKIPIISEGQVNHIITILRDITEQREAEEKLRSSEENFRTIAEQAFIGTLIIQNDQVEYVNNALLQIFEFSDEEVDKWSKDDLVKLIYPEDLHFLREYRERLRAGESDIKPYYSYRVFTKYGKIKWIDQFSRPIIYRGKPAEIITIMDITEKKKAEQELIKLNNLKSELLRRTSHELKTPLVSIKGFSDLLLTVHKEKLDDYVLATIHEIKLGCERLESLIQDILKTSELESESVELKKSEEDLSFLIKLCVKELQGLIRLRNHEIHLDIHDKLITRFEPDQIHLVVSNLLNNAIKYTPPNGKIKISSAITDEYILISIEDNGIGITNEEKRRLFTQFGKIERYGQGLDIISEGSGLGLFITKKIIELHGGMIRVRSKGRNKGSTFYFTLPLITEKKE